MVDFNPDFSDEDERGFELTENATEVKGLVPTTPQPVIVTPPSKDVLSMSNLIKVTQSHVDEDANCREVLASLTELLDSNAHLMSIKDILEYMKIKIREREFHTDCIFKAFQIVQKTELAKEMLIGSDRKERIIEATDRNKINRLLGMLNDNAIDEAKADE